MAQPAMPAGFATFLANIGQLPVDGGESPSFDQLLAAAPVASAPAASAAAPTIKVERALPAPATTPTADALPVEADAAVKAPVVKAEPAKADAAAVLAANLLIALNGAVPGTAPATGKPVPAETGTDTETEGADISEAATPAVPAAELAAVVAAIIPAAAKPAKPLETAPVPAGTSAAAPAPARPRDAAPPLPILAGAEPQAARPVDAAPSMTILFAQPAAQGAAMFADAAAPVQFAERVLDMDSDGAWIDQLARDIAATKSDSGDISFRLMPKHLGRLDVAMRMGDEGMSLKMDTRHEATATIVTAAQGRLVEDLRQQGVRVAGAEVTCTPGETGRQSQNQGQGRATAPDPSHLIETATERAEPRDEDRAADRRGRFA
ncbi:flagellar hook-length control protein FliK [Sphingopyxis sp.]|uniref:flagellar hook-length control protein FliK n=1 Tax=Sphingopyxis sp. TaxID=1908224 RepID=UPI002B461C73|nr:flagellar hook-length control protein FliK [Sphingopyxis sp.]HJS09663.1 flagellar hook-length control protein FliK [Sphingopyxis sp.]